MENGGSSSSRSISIARSAKRNFHVFAEGEEQFIPLDYVEGHPCLELEAVGNLAITVLGHKNDRIDRRQRHRFGG
ncbi:hypothetical protein ACLOJK_016289 [Asimina triloba]